MFKFSNRQLMVIGGVAMLVVAFAALIFINIRSNGKNSGKATIHVWGFDPKSYFGTLLSQYHQFRSNITIDYTEVPVSEYRDRLLAALAAGTGPDVLMIGNHDLPGLKDVLAPIPDTMFSLVQFQGDFPEVATKDFVSGGKIYAVPLYIDTLAMLYNKSYINSAGIAVLPKTWDGFDAVVPSLRTMSGNTLSRGATALGGTQGTVSHGMDILALLMLQNGTQMVDERTYQTATFATAEGSHGNTGLVAFNFYLQFASPASSLYTWNENAAENSLDSFAAGKTAIIFDYKSALAALEAKSPFLRVGTALMPQPSGNATRVDYANYAGLAVAKTSTSNAWAWDFAIYATTNSEGVNAYLASSHEPSALRSMIASEESNPDFSVFASQALTAQSWYKIDDKKVDAILNNAVASALAGQATPDAALSQAEAQVTQLMKP